MPFQTYKKTIEDFGKLPDFDKIIIAGMMPRIQMNDYTWTQHATATNTYYTDIGAEYQPWGMTEDDKSLTEKFSVTDVNGLVRSFYYDDSAERLYVRTTNSDSPASETSGVKDYCYVLYYKKHFATRPFTVEPYKQRLKDNYMFSFWLTSTNCDLWTETITGTSTITRESTVIADDSIHLYSMKITIDASANYAQAEKTFSGLKPGRKCKVRVLYKGVNATDQPRILIRNSGNNVYLTSNGEWTSTWTHISLPAVSDWSWYEQEFVAHGSYSDYKIQVRGNTASAVYYFQEVHVDRYYLAQYAEPFLPRELPTITQSVGSYIFPDAKISIGSLTINTPDAYWFGKAPSDVFLWHNTDVEIMGGSIDWSWDEMPYFFKGRARRPIATKHNVIFNLVDDRIEFRSLPYNKFNTTDYPNLDLDWNNKPKYFVLGGTGGHEMEPAEVNTSNYTYLYSDTFGGSYPVAVNSLVYKDGVLQTLTTHYTENLTNGTFTMNTDPGSAKITCKQNGIEDYSPFTATPYNGYPGRPAELIYFLLVIANGIDRDDLNMAALKDLYDNRNQQAQEMIFDEDTVDVLNRIQTSGVFQIFQRLDGTIECRRYRSDIPDNVLRLYDHDFIDWEIEEDTNHSYRYIRVKYKQNFAENKHEERDQDHQTGADYDADWIEWQHRIKDETLILDTRLETTAQCDNMIGNLIKMYRHPIRILKGTVKNHAALLLNPTDKLKVTLKGTYTVPGSGDVESAIFDDQTFQVYRLSKNLQAGNTYIEAFIGWDDLFFWWT